MKKLGKIIAFVGVAGAALAGLWYFLDNVKGSEEEDDCDAEEKDVADEERSYVSLDPVSEENKEALKKVVTDAVKENQAKAEEAAEGLGLVKDDVAEKANEFEFESFDKDQDEE